MASLGNRLLLTLLFTGSYVWCDPATSSKVFPHPPLCAEIVADLIPSLNIDVKVNSLPHVEIRRCSSPNPLQVVAWMAGAKVPALVEETSRFTVGQLLMNGNVFVITLPGPYDVVLVIRYTQGSPKIEFDNSTHAPISIASDEADVTVTLSETPQNRKVVKRFSVDNEQLFSSGK